MLEFVKNLSGREVVKEYMPSTMFASRHINSVFWFVFTTKTKRLSVMDIEASDAPFGIPPFSFCRRYLPSVSRVELCVQNVKYLKGISFLSVDYQLFS